MEIYEMAGDFFRAWPTAVRELYEAWLRKTWNVIFLLWCIEHDCYKNCRETLLDEARADQTAAWNAFLAELSDWNG